VIVDSAFGLINFHTIEISSSYNLIVSYYSLYAAVTSVFGRSSNEDASHHSSKTALASCCFRRQIVQNMKSNERDHGAAAVTPVTQRRTLPVDPIRRQLVWKQQAMDTKLSSAKEWVLSASYLRRFMKFFENERWLKKIISFSKIESRTGHKLSACIKVSLLLNLFR